MRFYEDFEHTSKNRLPARSYYIPGGKSEAQLLNGTWRFAYFSRDIDAQNPITKWDEISVPSCWQSLGYENPNYTNVNYPFPVDVPYVPDENPCGVYEREFTISSLWGRVFLALDGVATCGIVFVNGREVGYSQGSRMQAEYEITDFVHEGENTIRV